MKARRNILIVDDEKHIRTALLKVLALMLPDCKVDIAVNGAEAIDAFREGRYNLLIMDINMPVKDGFSAYLEIQEICQKEHINMPAVIFCTGYEPPKEILAVVARTPRHCILRKSAPPDTLMKEIQARL